jgi:hypothetical protein
MRNEEEQIEKTKRKSYSQKKLNALVNSFWFVKPSIFLVPFSIRTPLGKLNAFEVTASVV